MVAWLNEVQDWDGLYAVVCWASVAYLSRYQEDRYRVHSWLPALHKQAERESGLTLPVKTFEHSELGPVLTNQIDELVIPHRWFTSLWTLQEACLRPDMILCDKH